MSANIERLIGEQLESGVLPQHEQTFWQGVLESYRNQRLSPEFLQAELERQINDFLDREYRKHPTISQSRDKYKDSILRLQLEPQPEEYRGRLGRLGLIEGRIPWYEKATRAGVEISDYLRTNIGETRPFNTQSKSPDVLYVGWFNDWSQVFAEKIAPVDARKRLAEDLLGAGPSEGIDQYVHFPKDNLDGKYFDLIGYHVGSGHVAYLYRWDDRPRFNAYWGGSAKSYFRPLVRGSKIVTG